MLPTTSLAPSIRRYMRKVPTLGTICCWGSCFNYYPAPLPRPALCLSCQVQGAGWPGLAWPDLPRFLARISLADGSERSERAQEEVDGRTTRRCGGLDGAADRGACLIWGFKMKERRCVCVCACVRSKLLVSSSALVRKD
ncbi:hypothetical protein LX32DRAFT_446170 [Colletotrichum zoysiae]|uniref:Uncharacterized protein n=1 Tax=Colletotrichum zoysiae TaxID=1216348 RepID=A0AAD9HFB8_9PEZI|nr:hypothetical protein LX32DRAFT_446170 [Colletotrichum zoysiae]